MKIVLLAALGVGGATVFGAVVGFIFKNISKKFSNAVMSLAAGIMLSSSILGLIIPAMENADFFEICTCIAGLFCGAACITFTDRLLKRQASKKLQHNRSLDKVMLFVSAIAIHNFPEGIAAGVGFGSDDLSKAFFIAAGIALQNVPEGMVIISPMIATGKSGKQAFLIAAFTGAIEVVGTFVGYYTVVISQHILPFALCFAGGTMLYVICEEMIPETHSKDEDKTSTYTLLIGFAMMMFMDWVL